MAVEATSLDGRGQGEQRGSPLGRGGAVTDRGGGRHGERAGGRRGACDREVAGARAGLGGPSGKADEGSEPLSRGASRWCSGGWTRTGRAARNRN